MDIAIKQAIYTEPSQFGMAVNGVTTEGSFTCVDQQSGVVQCAGLNNLGQLGNGKFATGPDGTPQTVGGGQLLHGVTTGINHACALDDRNAAWCWGRGDDGQLGNGVMGVFNTPQPVLGGHTFRAIAAGKAHTCAIGLTTSSTAGRQHPW
jgi:alpha-tubulin suppressor-like RCC1 family protein